MYKLKAFKRVLVAAFATAIFGGVALAEGTAPIAWAGSTAEDIATAAQTTLANFLTGVGGIVALLIISGLAIWGGISLVGVVKRAFSVGKGR